MDVAVIGCYVNGPGESKEVDVGITGADPESLVYLDGKPFKKIGSEDVAGQLEGLIREKAKEKEAEREQIIASSAGAKD